MPPIVLFTQKGAEVWEEGRVEQTEFQHQPSNGGRLQCCYGRTYVSQLSIKALRYQQKVSTSSGSSSAGTSSGSLIEEEEGRQEFNGLDTGKAWQKRIVPKDWGRRRLPRVCEDEVKAEAKDPAHDLGAHSTRTPLQMTLSVDVADMLGVTNGSNVTFAITGIIYSVPASQGALRLWRKRSACAIFAPSEGGAYYPRGGCLMPHNCH